MAARRVGDVKMAFPEEKELWIVDQYAVPPSLTGFTRQYEHAQLLEAHGWKTTIFASPFDHKNHSMSRPTNLRHPILESIENGARFIWLHTIPYEDNNWRRYLNMVMFLIVTVVTGWFRRSPSVILASSPHLLSGLAGWVLARRHSVPFLLEIRDLWPESLVQLGLNNRLIVWTLERLELFLYRQADCIVPLTKGIESGIRAKGFEDKRIELLPNASLRPAPMTESVRRATRMRLGWRHKTVAIWMGAHGAANGLHVIVEAARLLQDHEDLLIVMVGEGPDKSRLIGLSRGLRNIKFLDSVPKMEVSDYLRAADIGILVHRDTAAVKGSRPNKLFDYFAAGLPIVSNIDGEARRIVEKANAGVFVPPEQPEALATALLELKESPTFREKLGSNGYRHVSIEHSREKVVQNLESLLDEVIVGKPVVDD